MLRRIKPVIVLIFILFHNSSFGQIPVNVPEYIAQKFSDYCASSPRQEIYIHTDRNEYIAGEDLWFNVYLVNRQSLKPSLTNKIAYFELLDPQNQLIMQKRIGIDRGFGPGQILLPDTLHSGTYTIIAYTNWMKNFLPYNCFRKDIMIYNSINNKKFKEEIEAPDSSGLLSGIDISRGIYNTGLTLEVNSHKPDSLEMSVRSTQNYRSVNNNLFYLVIQTHGIIDLISTETLNGDFKKITISKKALAPGINQVTILDSKTQVTCERYIYTPLPKGNEFFTVQMTGSFKLRSRCTVEIENIDSLSSAADLSNFSISVAPPVNSIGVPAVDDYLIFGSEFGSMPLAAIKNRKIDEIPPEFIDSLLMTVKSNWINWRTILSGKTPQFKHRVEKEDNFLSGKLLNSNNEPPPSGTFLILSAPGKVAEFQYAMTDYDGNFTFNIPVNEAIKDFIIQPEKENRNYKIIIDPPFSDQNPYSKTIPDSSGNFIPFYITTWSANYQVSKIYGSSGTRDFLPSHFPELMAKRFYGKPSIERKLDDFIDLSSMEEVFFEIVPYVALRKNNTTYEISIVDQFGNNIYDEPPTLMIDGIIVDDPSTIANLNPRLVEKIDVIRETYIVGDYTFYGIVNVITKSANFSCMPLPGYAVRLQYSVIDPVCSFVSPDYSAEELKTSRIPDFRNTLYWNPEVRRDVNGKTVAEFWTSDIPGTWEINIEGFTGSGQAVSFREVIRTSK